MEPEINQQILAELQQVRRILKSVLITFAVTVLTFFVAINWRSPQKEDDPLAGARAAARAFDYDRAARLVETLAARHPRDYRIHS